MIRIWFVVVTAAALAGCRSECDLGDDLSTRSGDQAQNCGRVLIGGATDTVDACAVTAFQAKKPFFARYDRQGFDSEVALAVAFDGQTMTFLSWDSSPSGGGYTHPLIRTQSCASPAVDLGRSDPVHPPFVCNPEGPSEISCQ